MAEKLLEVEYEEDQLVVRLRRPALRLLRPEVRERLLDARQDALRSVRHLIDAALSALEETDGATRSRRRTIDVE